MNENEKNAPSVPLSTSPALAAVLQYQQELAAAQSEVSRLSKAIQERQAEAARLKQDEPDLRDLDEGREALLAKIAVGDAKRAELVELDEQQAPARVEAATYRMKADLLERENGQAVAGLSRLLTTATEKLGEVRKREGRLIDDLILEESQAVYAEYLTAATCARDAWIRLYGFARLGNNEYLLGSFSGLNAQELDLPALRQFKSNTSSTGPTSSDDRFYSFSTHKMIDPSIHTDFAASEASILRDKGVSLALKY